VKITHALASFFTAIIFIFFVIIIGIMPFWLVYRLADLLYFLVYRVFHYRRDVIIQNLQKCFPLMQTEEIQALIPKIYKNLADVFVEGLKAFTMTKRQIVKRHLVVNPQVLNNYHQAGKTVIGVTGHYNNWEWGTMSSSLQSDFQVISLYKPLSNKIIDWLVHWSRSRCGTTLASIGNTTKVFDQYAGRGIAFLMVSDQSPTNRQKSYWVNWLGRDTAFLHGLEKHARQRNYPVLYIDVQRVKRGYYQVELSVIADNPQELPDGTITTRYAQKLETIIRNQPENWLWSHRRWKLVR